MFQKDYHTRKEIVILLNIKYKTNFFRNCDEELNRKRGAKPSPRKMTPEFVECLDILLSRKSTLKEMKNLISERFQVNIFL